MSDKRILIVSHEYPPIGGGGANACFFLSQEFAKKGNSVDIITVNYMSLKNEDVQNGVYIHRLDCKRKYKEHCSFSEMLDYLIKATQYAEHLVRERRFDICFVFFGIPSGPIGYVLKKKYNIPYVIRFGGGDVPGFQERFIILYKLLGPAIKIIWKNADALVANSEGLRKMALEYYDRKSFSVICNGVDTDFFRPTVDKKHSIGFVSILFVSRLVERKGLQYLIPKLKEIERRSSKSIQLTIVGDGPYRKELEQIIDDNQVSSLVHFAGQQNKNKLISYYQHADIFVLPSKREGMPNVILEAMACGLPIVMTPCQGADELICGNGFVVEIERFQEPIIELVNNDNLRDDMGNESIKRARTKFGWNSAAEKYLELFEFLYLH